MQNKPYVEKRGLPDNIILCNFAVQTSIYKATMLSTQNNQ